MTSIIHRVGIKDSTADIFASLSTAEGIAKWWTIDTHHADVESDSIQVRFHDPQGKEVGAMLFDIVSNETNRLVQWQFTDGPEEWIGTDVRFELKREGDFTIVLFSHNHWREAIEFTAHCSTKWATFLMSLKALHETGTGHPSPRDLKIDNWN